MEFGNIHTIFWYLRILTWKFELNGGWHMSVNIKSQQLLNDFFKLAVYQIFKTAEYAFLRYSYWIDFAILYKLYISMLNILRIISNFKIGMHLRIYGPLVPETDSTCCNINPYFQTEVHFRSLLLIFLWTYA